VTRPDETDVPTEDTAHRPAEKKGATMKVTIDEDKCCGAGSCVLAAPEVFDQRDEDGIVVLLDAAPGEDHHAAVRDAAAVCPAAAISFSEA
jgi:ferredoxin